MRSNIAATWPASMRPAAAAPLMVGISAAYPAGAPGARQIARKRAGITEDRLLQVRQEVDDVLQLFRRQALEGGHRRRRVDERSGDAFSGDPGADRGQRRPRA